MSFDFTSILFILIAIMALQPLIMGRWYALRRAQAIRAIEKAMGSYEKKVVEAEKPAHSFARRSIVSSRTIPRGTHITRDMVTFKRPGTGIYPKLVDVVIGRTAQQDIPEDTVITWEMI